MSNRTKFPSLKPCPLCADEPIYSVDAVFPYGNQRICVKCENCGLILEGNIRSGKSVADDFSQEDVRQIARKWNMRDGEEPESNYIHHIPLADEIEICTNCKERFCPGYCNRVKKIVKKGEKNK